MVTIDSLNITDSEKLTRKTALVILEKYNNLGDDFIIQNINTKYGIVGELMIKELPDNFFLLII